MYADGEPIITKAQMQQEAEEEYLQGVAEDLIEKYDLTHHDAEQVARQIYEARGFIE